MRVRVSFSPNLGSLNRCSLGCFYVSSQDRCCTRRANANRFPKELKIIFWIYSYLFLFPGSGTNTPDAFSRVSWYPGLRARIPGCPEQECLSIVTTRVPAELFSRTETSSHPVPESILLFGQLQAISIISWSPRKTDLLNASGLLPLDDPFQNRDNSWDGRGCTTGPNFGDWRTLFNYPCRRPSPFNSSKSSAIVALRSAYASCWWMLSSFVCLMVTTESPER